MASHNSPHRLSVPGLSDADVAGPIFIDETHDSRRSNAGGILIPFYCQHSNLQCLSVGPNFSTLPGIRINIRGRSIVSVPFHQIMRSTCPVFAILIYRFLYSRSYSTATYISLIPTILGVGLATYGDYYFTALGFFLTLLGVVLASAKTVASNRLMTGSLALSPLEILLRMSPLAAVQSLLIAIVTGEGDAFLAWVHEGNLTPRYALALASNGYLAFLLNITSFYTNKLAGALTITVCANLKQCLTILLGVMAFNVHVGVLNGCGMVIALVGAAIYSKVELDSKGKKEGPPPTMAYVPFVRKPGHDLELDTLSPKETVFG